jgi:hypothetical protein
MTKPISSVALLLTKNLGSNTTNFAVQLAVLLLLLKKVAVAYSLYRYAESKKRYALTVSEFYDAKQTEGIYRQFGVSRERFETILRTLKEDKNRVLNADLNMGLDNVNLRDDLSSMDILTMLM